MVTSVTMRIVKASTKKTAYSFTNYEADLIAEVMKDIVENPKESPDIRFASMQIASTLGFGNNFSEKLKKSIKLKMEAQAKSDERKGVIRL